MTMLRRHVRLWAMAWMLVQVASLSAFVPRDCCASHRPVEADADCHQAAPKAAHCPMRGADGAACPMHRDAEAKANRRETAPETAECTMGAACEGPPLFAVFWNPGILPDIPAGTAQGATPAPLLTVSEHPLSQTRPPDRRPPRA